MSESIASPPMIELRGVGKIFRRRGISQQAVQGVNLLVQAGEFICVAGPSGSGKTTLLNLMGVLDLPTTGEVVVGGRKTTGLDRSGRALLRRAAIGFIFQSYNLIPVLSAAENIEYALVLRGFTAKVRQDLAHRALAAVGLAEHHDKRPDELSGGQQQRVAVARAIAGAPPIILADEPTASLDSATGAALMDLLQTINREQGITFVFSSHDPMVIHRAERVIVLKDGMATADRSV